MRVNDENERIKDQALAWFVRINSGEATETERAEHRRWLSESAGHRREYTRLDAIWSDLEQIADPRTTTPARNASRGLALPRRRFLAGAALAAGAAGLMLANGNPSRWLSDFSTGTGEQRSLTLSDGSIVSLDADSAIDVRYDNDIRRIGLLRGRAFFDVAKDAGRAFVVDAAHGSTTAHGTRFVVHQWADAVTVSVEESAVSVVAPDRSDTLVKAGESISYGEAGLTEIATTDADSATAWRRGKLIFEDRPLRQVIADVNRYRSGTIRILDDRLLGLRVSGIFDIREPEGVLDAITSALPVKAVRLTSYLVLLRPA